MIFRAFLSQTGVGAICLSFVFATLGRGAADPFPEKPAGQVADFAKVLLPERAAALNAYLVAGAREQKISVYVLTVPSLGVPPSQQGPQMSALAHGYAERWMPGAVGVIILFVDTNAQVIVVGSTETDRRFPPWSRNLALADPLREIERSGELAREKLERTAITVFQIISQLQDQVRNEARRKRNISLAMGAIVLAGLAGILSSTLWRRRRVSPTTTEKL